MTPAQEQLVTSYLWLVVRIAGREAKRLPIWIEMDEVIAAGNLGLCQAAARFDPARGRGNFENWATWRIRGAIIDNFQGPRYPRRWEQMPAAWICDEMGDDFDGKGKTTQSREGNAHVPERLVDRSSVLDELIEREQCVVVSIDAVRARKTLSRDEGRVIDGHIGGRSLTEIAAKGKFSRSQARNVLLLAKSKMRAELEKEAA